MKTHQHNYVLVQGKNRISGSRQTKRRRNEAEELGHDCRNSSSSYQCGGHVKFPAVSQGRLCTNNVERVRCFCFSTCQSIQLSPGTQRKTMRSGRYVGVTHNPCNNMIVWWVAQHWHRDKTTESCVTESTAVFMFCNSVNHKGIRPERENSIIYTFPYNARCCRL